MKEQDKLIQQFNNRNSSAFETVYLMFYREMRAYTAMLYRHTNIEPDDALHDVYLDLWVSKSAFENTRKIKSYLYTAIINDFKNYLVHSKCIDKHKQIAEADENFGIDVFESELYSEVEMAINMLPHDFAEIVKLFVEGYKPAEIAKMLGRTQQNVYNMKHEAINILKLKNVKNKLLLIMFLNYC